MRGPSLCGGGAHAYYIKGESEERSERRGVASLLCAVASVHACPRVPALATLRMRATPRDDLQIARQEVAQLVVQHVSHRTRGARLREAVQVDREGLVLMPMVKALGVKAELIEL